MSSRRGAKRRKKEKEILQARLASRIDVFFDTTELIAELIADALETVMKEDRWDAGCSISFPREGPARYEYPFTADDIQITVLDGNVIKFKHYPEIEVDNTADLITDADKVEALLNWIYEGGQFPLLKETGER